MTYPTQIFGGQVWILDIGVQDPQCYAEGTEYTIRVYATREGAVAGLQQRFPELDLDTAGDGVAQGMLAEIYNQEDENDDGTFPPASEVTRFEVCHVDWPDEARFQWSWAIYPRPVND